MNALKRIYLSPNPKKDEGLETTFRIYDLLCGEGCTVVCSSACIGYRADIHICDKCPSDSELIVVVGGDGSFIDASSDAIRLDIPIIGVNLGRVGYLSEVSPSDIEQLKRIITGDYTVSEKNLIETSFGADGEETISERLAVNDVVISHTSYIEISDFVVSGNEGGVRYRADGVVISTPQGSTAYSFSAGGPVVSHGTDAMIVTPIAPHSFFNRSIIFSAGDTLNIKNTGDSPMNISVDGRLIGKLLPSEKCKVACASEKLKVLTFKENNMFFNLFGKMQTVEDVL